MGVTVTAVASSAFRGYSLRVPSPRSIFIVVSSMEPPIKRFTLCAVEQNVRSGSSVVWADSDVTASASENNESSLFFMIIREVKNVFRKYNLYHF